jgi:predicted nuclease of predicted toxin-antitoxin system
VKLLVDENLSYSLAASLADLFPGSKHVRDVGLRGCKDPSIWEYAKSNDLCILTKDLDFQARSILYESPPKVILVRLGNCTTARVEIALRNSLEAIHRLELDRDVAMLVIP